MNVQKQDALPADWVKAMFPSAEKRATYLADNDLDVLPLDLTDYMKYFEERKLRIREHQDPGTAVGADVSPSLDQARFSIPCAKPPTGTPERS